MDAYQRLTTLAALHTKTEAADEYMYVVRTTLAPLVFPQWLSRSGPTAAAL